MMTPAMFCALVLLLLGAPFAQSDSEHFGCSVYTSCESFWIGGYVYVYNATEHIHKAYLAQRLPTGSYAPRSRDFFRDRNRVIPDVEKRLRFALTEKLPKFVRFPDFSDQVVNEAVDILYGLINNPLAANRSALLNDLIDAAKITTDALKQFQLTVAQYPLDNHGLSMADLDDMKIYLVADDRSRIEPVLSHLKTLFPGKDDSFYYIGKRGDVIRKQTLAMSLGFELYDGSDDKTFFELAPFGAELPLQISARFDCLLKTSVNLSVNFLHMNGGQPSDLNLYVIHPYFTVSPFDLRMHVLPSETIDSGGYVRVMLYSRGIAKSSWWVYSVAVQSWNWTL